MKLFFQKHFVKAWHKLTPKMQEKVEEAIELFKANPHDPVLDNHALRGDLEGKRAIRVTWDVRIVFEEFDDYAEVLLVDVGSHNQVY